MIVATAQDAANLFAPLLDQIEGEKLVVAHLDGRRRLLALIESARSDCDHVELPTRRILEDALRFGATDLVLAHNHPSGRLQPSLEDLDGTRDLANIAARLGIRIRDHLILAGGEFSSMRGLGLL
jgi:DNA repair protein RadC